MSGSGGGWWRRVLGLGDAGRPGAAERAQEKERELLEAKEAQFDALKEFAVKAQDEDLLSYVQRRERALKRLRQEYEVLRLGASPGAAGARSAGNDAERR